MFAAPIAGNSSWTLKIAGQDSKRLLTDIPPQLNSLLARLGLLPLFSQPPAWAEA